MTNSIHTNFIGRILGTGEIRLEDTLITSLKNNQEKACYSLIGCKTFAKKETSFVGNKFIFEFDNKKMQFKFLKEQGINSFIDAFNEVIYSQVNEYLIRVLTEFNLLVLKEYPRDSWMKQITEICKNLYEVYSEQSSSWQQHFSEEQIEKINRVADLHPVKPEEVRELHEQYQLKKRKHFFDQVESNPLTLEQRLGVIRTNDRNMVLAAAGTGKTSVMVAKALDIIDRGLALPSEILILAYNKAAANELQERLIEKAKKGNISLESTPHIATFHALGRQLLRESGVPTNMSIFTEDSFKLKQWVTNWIYEYIAEDPTRIFDMIELVTPPVNPFSFSSAKEYESYVRDNEFRTLNGDEVKGYQELQIANFLFINQIPYEYETPYVSKQRVDIGFDYKPDFHISDTSLYIEHYGIDRKGNTRADINATAYNESIKKKLQLHKDYKTDLIETYHYEWCENTLLSGLKEKLKAFGIEGKPMHPNDIFEKLNGEDQLSTWCDLMVKALQAIRVECLSRSEIEHRLSESKVNQAEKYSALLSKLHEAYVEELKHQNSIDFDDMIIRSAQVVDSGEYQPMWKYVLVDEFQDISESRMSFIKGIIDKGPTPSLTVVGDDWQSIYRFSGGKLELTTRFDEKVGPHSLTMLQKTFRYNNSIADTAGSFVMENPEQYKKHIVTHTTVKDSQVYLYDDNLGEQDGDVTRIVDIVKSIRKKDPDGSIAIIARYNYLLKNASDGLGKENLRGNTLFWSFHKSKGLEADYCILTGFFQGKKGFPNESLNDAMIEALLPSLDLFPHSEERRLLYVGITRAKKACHIIANPTSPSDFIMELLAPKYDLNIQSPYFEAQYMKMFKCPNCESGSFRLIKGKFGSFYSCSSGKACEVGKARACSQCQSPSVDTRNQSVCQNSSCGNAMTICDKCGRPMKRRTGKFGEFWGCSGYGIKHDQCRNTRK